MTPEERFQRIERVHEELAQTVQLLARLQADGIAAIEKQQERTEAGLQELRISTQELQASTRELEASTRQLQTSFRRAIRLTIREFRNERRRRQSLAVEFDQKMTQLASAQLLTEEKLQRLIQSLERGPNGHSQ